MKKILIDFAFIIVMLLVGGKLGAEYYIAYHEPEKLHAAYANGQSDALRLQACAAHKNNETLRLPPGKYFVPAELFNPDECPPTFTVLKE